MTDQELKTAERWSEVWHHETILRPAGALVAELVAEVRRLQAENARLEEACVAALRFVDDDATEAGENLFYFLKAALVRPKS